MEEATRNWKTTDSHSTPTALRAPHVCAFGEDAASKYLHMSRKEEKYEERKFFATTKNVAHQRKEEKHEDVKLLEKVVPPHFHPSEFVRRHTNTNEKRVLSQRNTIIHCVISKKSKTDVLSPLKRLSHFHIPCRRTQTSKWRNKSKCKKERRIKSGREKRDKWRECRETRQSETWKGKRNQEKEEEKNKRIESMKTPNFACASRNSSPSLFETVSDQPA
jgi:hypothetical protein